MSRRPAVIADHTRLDGSQIDVAARIGWLLRCSRTAAGVDLRTMAAGLTGSGVPISAASLSRLETEGNRQGTVIDGYERVLGLDAGHLRGTVDTLCRSFDYAPVDQSPDREPLSLPAFDDLVAAVSAGQAPAGAWLRFAQEHARPRGYGLTGPLMRPLVRTLASELSRTVGSAYLARYEALARLRCSAYAEVVEQEIRDLVLAPDVQVLYDVISALAELPTPSLLDWAGELLNHDSLIHVRGGDILIQSMRSIGGLPQDAWGELVEPFTTAFHRASGDQTRRSVLTVLFKNLPAETRAAIRPRLTEQLEPVPGPLAWTKNRRNHHHGIASQLAAETCAEVGLAEEPMLARLLFELLYDFRGPRSTAAAVLVLVSPFADAVHDGLFRLATDSDDPATRAGARSAVSRVQSRTARPVVTSWLASPEIDLVRAAYTLGGHAGQLLTDEQLERGLAGDPGTVRLVLYAAGMAGDPRLPAISLDRRHSAEVRAAAAYWVREGARIVR